MKAIIAGGGTGGHLFPGIAVAREIQRRYRGAEILFVGADRGIESRIIPKEGFSLRTLPVGGLKGQGLQRQMKNAGAMIKAVLDARHLLAEVRPDIVIGVGGYASFPVLAAAIWCGVPRIIMEQNAMPGLANRVLAKWADFAAITDPRTASYFGGHAVVTGNPVRPEFKNVPPRTHQEPYTVLIFGGSQGAQSINRAATEALEFLEDLKRSIRFVHQAGEQHVATVRAGYQGKGFESDVRAFFHDFHEQYAKADLIVARSGATSVAEIKAAGKAAILVPFPFAADDHQTQNAQAMVAESAAVMVADGQLNGQRLAVEIRSLLLNPARLALLESNARRLATPDAEERIVNLIEPAMARHRRN